MFSFWVLLFIVAAPFAIAAFLKGAPFVPVKVNDLDKLFEYLDIKPGQGFVDYGSGNGSVVRGAAKRGAHAIGYEINPFLVLVSKLLQRSTTSGSQKFQLADMWKSAVPEDTSYVYTFLLPKHIEAFKDKVQQEIAKPVLFISYSFPLKDVEPLHVIANCFIYELSPLDKASNKT